MYYDNRGMTLVEQIIAVAITSVIVLGLMTAPVYSIFHHSEKLIDKTKDSFWWGHRVSAVLKTKSLCLPSLNGMSVAPISTVLGVGVPYLLNSSLDLKDADSTTLVRVGNQTPEGVIQNVSLTILSRLRDSYLGKFEITILTNHESVDGKTLSNKPITRAFTLEFVTDVNNKISSCGANPASGLFVSVENDFTIDTDASNYAIPCLRLVANDLDYSLYPQGKTYQFSSTVTCPNNKIPFASSFDPIPALSVSYLIQATAGENPCSLQYDGPVSGDAYSWHMTLCCFYDGTYPVDPSVQKFGRAKVVCQ